MRRHVVGDVNESAAWGASLAGFGQMSVKSVSDADEIDESSASLKKNAIKGIGAKTDVLLLIPAGS